jgi:hypothetical protein
MAGLKNLCKMYGSMKINGVEWIWDYARDCAVLKSEMTKEQEKASIQAKGKIILDQLTAESQKLGLYGDKQ